MKLIEDQYEREITEKYAALSIADVSKKELEELRETIEREVYTFGLFGHLKILSRSKKPGSWVTEYSFSSPRSKNEVKLDYYEGNKNVNVFIHGPKAGDIKLKLRELIPEEKKDNLEDLALNERKD